METNNGGCCGIIGIILVIAFVVYALNGFKNPSNAYSQSVGGFIGIGVEYPSKIMEYTGSKLMKTCLLPYYSDSECYFLNVSSNGEVYTKINFTNGGYVYLKSVTCTELATWYNNTGDNRFFCTGFDSKGEEWDISLPTSNGDL